MADPTGFWQIILPQAVANICTNPSFESAATGWTAGAGHSLARSSAQSFKGAYSGLVTIGGAGTVLADYAVSALTASGVYYVSAWVYVPSNWDGGDISLGIANLAGASASVVYQWTAGTSPFATWTLIVTRVTMAADVAGNFQVVRSGTANTGKTMHFDAVQFEENANNQTTYCDGEQPGCLWIGTRYLSASERDAQVRSGGKVVNLETLNAFVVQSSGAGMTPVKPLTQSQALLPGALYAGDKTYERKMVLIFDLIGTSRSNLHLQRKNIIDYIKGERVKGAQPFTLRYTGANTYKPIECRFVYSGGAEMGLMDGYTERIALQLTAYDPYWYELADQAAILGGIQTIATVNRIMSKIDGVWAILSTGLNGTPRCMAVAPDGTLYVGGSFTTAGGTTVNYIARWNGTAWSALGAGPGLNGAVYDMVFGPDGRLYITGAFDDVMGGAGGTYNRIVLWNGSAFSALSTGFNDWGRALTIGLDGKLYAGGHFTTAGGTAVNRITYWDGAAWNAMNTGATKGVNDYVFALKTLTSGEIILGGQFTSAGGSVGFARVCKYSPLTNTFISMGGGIANNSVLTMVVHPSGEVHVGGDFTSATTGNYLSIWNGSFWRSYPSEVNAAVQRMGSAPNGDIWIAGSFTQAGTLLTGDRIAIWNGSGWSLSDIDFPGTPVTYAFAWNQAGDFWIGFDTSGTITSSAPFTVTNAGTTKAYPKFVIQRSGGTSAQIKWIKNETTGKVLYFNEYILLDGETLEIILAPGARSVWSSLFGKRWDALLPSTQVTEWNLLPGSNVLTLYVLTAGSPTLTVLYVAPIPHLGVDGVAS